MKNWSGKVGIKGERAQTERLSQSTGLRSRRELKRERK